MSGHGRLTARQLEVLGTIEAQPDWSIEAAGDALGLSRAGMQYHLTRAREACGQCSSVGMLIANHYLPVLHTRVVVNALLGVDD